MATISSEEDKNSDNYIVFFDLDGTLIAENSGMALVRHAYRKGMMDLKFLLKAIYLGMIYKLKLKDPLVIIDNMALWVTGQSEKSIGELSSEVSVKTLIPSIRQEVFPEIIRHREQKARIVILSSALRSVCLEISDHLGMDDILCSDLEVIDGYCTGSIKGPLCFGTEKAERMKEYCEKNNTSLKDAWYYGDSIHDLPALSIVGNPVCINPDKKLKKAALKFGWELLSW